MDYKAYCRQIYLNTFKTAFANNGKQLSIGAEIKARINAQRKAIDKSFIDTILKYPDIPEKDIWGALGLIHKINTAQLADFGIPPDKQEEVFKKCLAAHQSWIKSGGHSFERYISDCNSSELKKNEIRFILQSELTKLIKRNKLKNTAEDIKGLKDWGKDFDLYAIQTVHGDIRVFGCIQSKTSIRDRVGRDVSFSHNAMDALFWSAAVTLNGTFLHLPEFIHMVNGGGSYKTNGWHGMYVLSGIDKENDRIYKDNDKLDILISHAIEAAKQFISDRRKLNHSWKA